MYEFIKALALPPASLVLIFLLGLVAAALKWRRTSLMLTCTGFFVLYFLSTPFGAGRLALLVQARTPFDEKVALEDPPGAIVILSAGLLPYAPEYGEGDTNGITVDAATLQRLAYGAYLWRHYNHLPILVTGGAAPDAPQPLSFYMRGALEQNFGIPVTWEENRSRNTLENAKFSAEILRGAGIKRVLLVTHAAHMPRAMRFFALTGLDPVAAPTVFTPAPSRFPQAFRSKISALEDSTFAIYELFGSAWHRLATENFSRAPLSP